MHTKEINKNNVHAQNYPKNKILFLDKDLTSQWTMGGLRVCVEDWASLSQEIKLISNPKCLQKHIVLMHFKCIIFHVDLLDQTLYLVNLVPSVFLETFDIIALCHGCKVSHLKTEFPLKPSHNQQWSSLEMDKL